MKKASKTFAVFALFGFLLILFSALGLGHLARAGDGNWWTVAEKKDNYDAIRGVCDEKTGNLLYETSSHYVSIITVVPGGCAGTKPPRQNEIATPTPTPAPASPM